MTSNLGGGEITELMTGGMGIYPAEGQAGNGSGYKVGELPWKRLVGIFTGVHEPGWTRCGFSSIAADATGRSAGDRAGTGAAASARNGRGQFLFRVTSAARDFCCWRETDQRYGARHLKRAIERHIVYPLATCSRPSKCAWRPDQN